MRHPTLVTAFVLGLAGGAFALDLNVDLGVGSERARQGSTAWSVEVCRPATEAQQVKIEVAQPGSKDRETLVWDRAETRHAGAVQELPMPTKFRDLGKIWVQGTAEPKNNDVLMAVLYEGKPKRVYSFNKSEKHEVSIKDPDASFDCPTG